MADIHIVREHGLGLARARKLAMRWVEEAQQHLDLECAYEEGRTSDAVRFERPGASGQLTVTADRFELNAKLGLLLGMFKGRIEGEIVKNLDELLAHEDPLHAFEQGVAQHKVRREAKHAPRHDAKAAKPRAEPHKPAAKPAARKAK